MESEAHKRKIFNSHVFNYLAKISDDFAISFVDAVGEVDVQELPETEEVIESFVRQYTNDSVTKSANGTSVNGHEQRNGKTVRNEAINSILNGKVAKESHSTVDTDGESNQLLSQSMNDQNELSLSASEIASRKRKSSPYRRVRAEEVQVPNKLLDNSYDAKIGAKGVYGYGERANEVLKTVHGRDFRHEKTKKKRGTYRGGLIDMNAVNSIRFDDD